MYEITYIMSGVTAGVTGLLVLVSFGIYTAMLLHVRATLQDLQDIIVDVNLLFQA